VCECITRTYNHQCVARVCRAKLDTLGLAHVAKTGNLTLTTLVNWFIANLDVINGAASVVGIVLGIPGFAIGLYQLIRTKRAAEAAAESARQTAGRIANVLAVTSLEQICSRSRELLQTTRARNSGAAAIAAFELREALAKFSRAGVAANLQRPEAWSTLLQAVGEIHNVLERAAAIRRIDTRERENVLQSIAAVHSELSMLATVAAESAGDVNADS
jgi:hypothetical protein